MKTMPRLLVQLTALLLAPCLVVAADPFPGIGGPVGSSGHGPRVTDNVFSSQAIPPPGVNELAPIVPGDLSNEVHALDRDHLLPGNRAAPARPTILIAEDQPDTYTFLTEMLTEVGYEVMAAMDGEAALALFESVPPGTISAVITDGIMPKMSGGQLVEKLYSKQQDLLIILTTDLEGITEAIVQEYPQIAVIPKPYTINTILSVFAKRLQQSTSSAGAGEQVPSAGMLMDAFFAGLEGPQALQLRKSVGEKSLFRDSALQAGAAESALNALRQLQHFYSQSLDREVVKSQQAVMALAKKADDMIAAIPDLPVQQMIDDLATDLFAVERLDAAEWPSRQEGIRDGFQALGEKLHVMIRGLEHWPAGRAYQQSSAGGYTPLTPKRSIATASPSMSPPPARSAAARP